MDKLNLMLRNIQISLQILLWIFLFYSLDFDLFTYMFNGNIILKSLFGIGLMCIQLYLFQNLYNLVEIDSIYINDNDKELENISEKHDYTSCKKCNKFRPKRAHHCRFCNKCILEMDHHCFSLNKCIGKNNYNNYIKYLIFVELNTSVLLGSSLYVCYNYYSQLSLYYLIKYVLISIASFLTSVTLYLYLIFLAYLYLTNLTTLEFIYPKLRLTHQNLTQ
jgi:palmitoyltransferase